MAKPEIYAHRDLHKLRISATAEPSSWFSWYWPIGWLSFSGFGVLLVGVGFKTNNGRQSQLCREIISVCRPVKLALPKAPLWWWSDSNVKHCKKCVSLMTLHTLSSIESQMIVVLKEKMCQFNPHYKSFLPFSSHHPGLPTIKVDRKQVSREQRTLPHFSWRGSGATCK